VGVDRKGQRHCDDCGRDMAVAVRIHQGAEYCRACYSRVFVLAQCPTCKGSLRRHRHAPETTQCSACERATRVCVRCRRLTPRAAKLVDGHPVCGSCAAHFSEAKTCHRCGKKAKGLLTSLLAAADANDSSEPAQSTEGQLTELICRSCKNKNTHATCSACRRHRKVVGETTEGKPLCAGCAKEEPDSHACPCCGAITPGSGLARCFVCVRREAAARKARLLGASLEHLWCRELWSDFAAWLTADNARVDKASSSLDSAADYFRLIESGFDGREAITGDSMHRRIASPIHRRHLLAYRFVLKTLNLVEAAEDRASANEDRRLAQILAQSSGLACAELLEAYTTHLQGSGVAHRTVRLYAGVALRFCETARADSTAGWKSGSIQRFLQHTPGAASSLSKFITYCRSVRGWDVAMPPKQVIRSAGADVKRSVERMRRALSRVDGRQVNDLKLKEVSRVIAAATGLTLRELLSASGFHGASSDSHVITLSQDARIEPGHPLHPYATRWAALIEIRRATKESVR
jgi:hypothetical protein